MALVATAVTVWTAGAAALEGGWFETIDELERQGAGADEEAAQMQRRAAEIDDYLSSTLTDADTAARVDRQMRREVAQDVAQWSADMRRAERAGWGQGPAYARGLRRAMEASRWPATEEWQRQVRLLAELADGIADAGQLLVRRAELEVFYAQRRALYQKADAEREWTVKLANDGGDSEKFQEEARQVSEALDVELARLRHLPSDRDFHRKKGALIPPVSAEIEYPYGPRQRENSYTEVRHTGVTYAVDVGTKVRSVASGEVAFAERLPGFGKVVIVDHGEEYHSLFAHLKEFDLEVGDQILGRQVVGRSGETGSLEGPKLYFELRRQGRPVDPEEWFVSD